MRQARGYSSGKISRADRERRQWRRWSRSAAGRLPLSAQMQASAPCWPTRVSSWGQSSTGVFASCTASGSTAVIRAANPARKTPARPRTSWDGADAWTRKRNVDGAAVCSRCARARRHRTSVRPAPAQRLPVHARRPCRIRTLVAVQHQCPRQQPTRDTGLRRPGRMATQACRALLRPRDRNRHVRLHHRAGIPPPPSPEPHLLTFEAKQTAVGISLILATRRHCGVHR